MDQRLSILTIGVNSLVEMKKFYTDKFGWKVEAEAKDIVFFKLNGMLLGLYGRNDLAHFTGRLAENNGSCSFTMACMVNSKTEVESLYDQFKTAGVQIIKEPQEPSFGGYYFLAADMEGNIWEIAWNLFMTLDENGNILSHKNISNL